MGAATCQGLLKLRFFGDGRGEVFERFRMKGVRSCWGWDILSNTPRWRADQGMMGALKARLPYERWRLNRGNEFGSL